MERIQPKNDSTYVHNRGSRWQVQVEPMLAEESHCEMISERFEDEYGCSSEVTLETIRDFTEEFGRTRQKNMAGVPTDTQEGVHGCGVAA